MNKIILFSIDLDEILPLFLCFNLNKCIIHLSFVQLKVYLPIWQIVTQLWQQKQLFKPILSSKVNTNSNYLKEWLITRI